jgi:hypothetical protein
MNGIPALALAFATALWTARSGAARSDVVVNLMAPFGTRSPIETKEQHALALLHQRGVRGELTLAE